MSNLLGLIPYMDDNQVKTQQLANTGLDHLGGDPL